jgi:hypothetical protein
VSLQRKIFPWIEEAKENLREKDPNCERRTAMAFLNLMEQLRVVILQDAAVMIEIVDRQQHQVFTELEVFSTNEFISFKNEMSLALGAVVDPRNAALDTVLPGVKERLDSVNTTANLQYSLQQHQSRQVDELGRQVESLRTDIRADVNELATGISQHILQVNHKVASLAKNLNDAASAFVLSNHSNNLNELRLASERFLNETSASGRNQPQIVPIFPRPSSGSSVPPSPTMEENATSKFSVPCKWRSFDDLMDFWLGRGNYQDQPIEGGVEAMERLKKSSWRRHLSDSQAKAFSRLKIVCTIATSLLQEQKVPREQLRKIFEDDSKNVICRCEKVFKNLGYHQPKARKKKDQCGSRPGPTDTTLAQGDGPNAIGV